jgi:hypothetical protein
LAKSPESDIDTPITNGGPELVAEPGKVVVAELEHALNSNAAAKHASAVRPERPTVLIMCIPSCP